MENENMQLQEIKKENRLKVAFEYLISTRWFAFLIGIVILLKTIFFYGNTVFKNDTIWLWSIRQTCFFIVIIVFPMLLFRKPVRRFECGIIINIFISVLLFADELYYTYAQNILSVMQTGNMQYKDEIIAAIPSLLNKNQVLYFLDLILIAVLLIGKWIRVKNNQEKFKFIPPLVTLRIYFIFLLVLSFYSRITGTSNRVHI